MFADSAVVDTSRLPFTSILEDNYGVFRRELDALIDRYYHRVNRHFQLWPEEGVYNKDWNLFGLLNGYNQEEPTRLEANTALCPETTRILESIPGIHNAGFSLLANGTYIRPHWGPMPILRVHMGLIVPKNCGIKIRGQTCYWKEGRVFPSFIDTSIHEAWNYSGVDDPRVIPLMDFRCDDVQFQDALADRRSWLAKLMNRPQILRRHLYHYSGVRPGGVVGLPHRIMREGAYLVQRNGDS